MTLRRISDEKNLGIVFVLAGLFCFNSCKNYIDQLSIAGNKYIMTNMVPVSDDPDSLSLSVMQDGCSLTFNSDGSSYVQKRGTTTISSGSYDVNTSGNSVTLTDSSTGVAVTYTFSDRATVLSGRESWSSGAYTANFTVTYRLN